jgi:hypothetical protein
LRFSTRLAIVAASPLAAIFAIAIGRSMVRGLSLDVSMSLAISHNWLIGATVFYLVNYLVAWKYANSWPISMSRMLIWSILAYICISNIVDIFGMHKEIAWQIVGVGSGGSPETLTGLRAHLSVWIVVLAMSVTCIAVGFETSDPDLTQ